MTALSAAGFCVAAAFLPGILGFAVTPRWWAIAAGVPLASSCDPRNVDRPILLCLACGIAWAAASIAWAPVPAHALLDLYFVALLALAMMAAAGLDDVEPVLAWFGWGVAISSAVALAQFFGWKIPVPGYAPAGTFLNSEVLAELAAPLAAWAALRGRWALAAAMAVPLAVCGSRIAPAAACVGLACGLPWRRWTIPALALAALAAAAPVLLINPATAGNRIVLWITAVHSLAPLGNGLGWWAAVHPEPFEQFVHSDALQLMVELGAGSAFFLAIPLLLARRWNAAEPGEHAACAAIAVEVLVSFPLHLPASGFLAAVLAGSLARARAPVRVLELSSGDDAVGGVRRQPSPGAAMDGGRRPGDLGLPVRPQRDVRGGMGDPARGGSLTWTSTR